MNRLPAVENDHVNVVVLVKGTERYIFSFDEQNITETRRQLGRFASNPDLSLTWYDAAILSQRIVEMTRP